MSCVADVRAGVWTISGMDIDETIAMPGGVMVGVLIDLLAGTMVGIATGVSVDMFIDVTAKVLEVTMTD